MLRSGAGNRYRFFFGKFSLESKGFQVFNVVTVGVLLVALTLQTLFRLVPKNHNLEIVMTAGRPCTVLP